MKNKKEGLVPWLDRIIQKKRERVEAAKKKLPLEKIKGGLTRRPDISRSFKKVLSEPGISIIAEVKRASPSAGTINAHCNPVDQARAYFKGGASAISVLTEQDYFKGDLEDLRAIKNGVPVSVLRKDFIIDEYQIYESALSHADAILLIAAALSRREIRLFLELAEELGMDCLVEVHEESELEKIDELPVNIIGVNNRNLSTLAVDLNNSFRLYPHLPEKAVKVSESGISRRVDAARLEKIGFDAILVGECLMKSGDPERTIQNLLGKSDSQS